MSAVGAMGAQYTMFDLPVRSVPAEGPRRYKDVLSVSVNQKGVLDVDTVKGCSIGMRARPVGGCYGECYAAKIAARYGIDFSTSVSRKLMPWNRDAVLSAVYGFRASWYRIGTFGEPCHDWENTLSVCEALQGTGKTPVIITKHWLTLTDDEVERLRAVRAVVNTSTSGLDTDAETAHRVGQIERLRASGVRSINRVVTCAYGASDWARAAHDKQDYLLSIGPVIDNPLRVTKSNLRVLSGELLIERRPAAIGGGKVVSLHSPRAYLGTCADCPDQCGVEQMTKNETKAGTQVALFDDHSNEDGAGDIEWVCVESVLGSGYEADVARLAIEDKIAKRAARKNMQIHSAVILKLDGRFTGFMTFQKNHEVGEFCLLQSVIEPTVFTPALYSELVERVIAENHDGYPAIITTDPKSKFETPKLFENLGFETYLKMSGFHYMVRGDVSDVRMKLLAHVTMTNVWTTTKGDWLRIKREWNARINAAGERVGVPNPLYATREGCWQGVNGYSNVVNTRRSINEKGEVVSTTKSHNSNASVLDPVACEVIARFFMPASGGLIYNPFGGGVQMGYVAGASGYRYLATEIRQNQVDANNKICAEFAPEVEWVLADSSTYDPGIGVDLVFACPPYYRVEKYLDYDGVPPDGEINDFSTYDEFRDALFAGYEMAIHRLNDNRFMVIMTGDSRDKKGAYHCHEAETELFLRDQGLKIYNRIVYVEAEFTRLAHAKGTLNTRKFPKREQKIIVAYKGKVSDIKKHFAPLGRL